MPTPISSNQVAQTPSTSAIIPSIQINQSENFKQNMITEFSKISNLNLTWSKE